MIWRYGRSATISFCVKAVVIAGVACTLRSLLNNQKLLQDKLNQSQTNLAQLTVKFDEVNKNVWQASNAAIQTQSQLKQDLSKELSDYIKQNETTILARINAGVTIAGKGEGPASTISTNTYQYKDDLVDILTSVHRDPVDPLKDTSNFKYSLFPQSISLTGILGFEKTADSKGIAKFLLNPTVASNSRLQLTTTSMEFKPSEEFNKWVNTLRTPSEPQIVRDPIPFNVSVMYGQADRGLMNRKNVFGGGVSYVSPFGVSGGGGYFNDAWFVQLGYSFGKVKK